MNIKRITCLFLTTSFLLAGCSSMPKTPEGFKQSIIETEKINFVTWEKETTRPEETLRFYIEGNGTPNPKKPISLILAQEDETKNIIVLSRVCQYIDNPICKNHVIWGKQRYHTEILKEMEELTIFFIKKYRPKDIEFVAYSDAAPIAFYLAQRLGHTKQIVTIAGVLDVTSYQKQNDLPQFKNIDQIAINKHFATTVPQIHYIGGDDEIVTRSMTERFISQLNRPKNITVKVVHDFDHDDWDKIKLKY